MEPWIENQLGDSPSDSTRQASMNKEMEKKPKPRLCFRRINHKVFIFGVSISIHLGMPLPPLLNLCLFRDADLKSRTTTRNNSNHNGKGKSSLLSSMVTLSLERKIYLPNRTQKLKPEILLSVTLQWVIITI